jgi:DHA1 family bicyclomycin/chloramphenicol resistance-like MFS transporter
LSFGLTVFIALWSAARWRGMSNADCFRFLQALGGAPARDPGAVVRDHFDERESVRMLSMLILVMGLAPILGP